MTTNLLGALFFAVIFLGLVLAMFTPEGQPVFSPEEWNVFFGLLTISFVGLAFSSIKQRQ